MFIGKSLLLEDYEQEFKDTKVSMTMNKKRKNFSGKAPLYKFMRLPCAYMYMLSFPDLSK